jgi:hypothetical protein
LNIIIASNNRDGIQFAIEVVVKMAEAGEYGVGFMIKNGFWIPACAGMTIKGGKRAKSGRF